MRKDDHLIYEAFKSNALKDADGVEIVNPNVRKFDNNFHLDEYLQRILYNYRKYQNPEGSLNKEKLVQAIDSIWTGTHPRALQNLHQELLKIRGGEQGGYNPPEKDFYPYLKDWLQKEAMSKVWSKISINSEEKPQQYAKDMEKDYTSQKISGEDAEDMSKSPFHYDPMVGLEKAAREIRDILLSSANDEARTEHIEKMAHIILGSPKDHDPRLYNKMLEGLIILLNRFIVVEMNEGEESGMPTKEFMSLKQHINKGPIKVNKPTKELPYTHKYINQLAKQDPREGQREENAEKRVYDDVEVAFNLSGRAYIAYGDVHFGEDGIHGKGEDTVENFVVLDAQTRQEIKDGAVLKHGYNAVYNAGVNQSAEENGEDEGELMTHMKQAGMIPKGSKPTTGPHTTRERRSENEERRLDPKCWKGYHKQGTKLKGGKRVNNCVKNS